MFTKSNKKIIFPIIAFLLGLSVLLSCFCPHKAYADSDSSVLEAFDKVSVMDDLKSIKNFDISNVQTSGSDIVILDFVEFGFNFKRNEEDDFGLYIYVYNASGKSIVNSTRNKAQLAVGYDKDGNPNDYYKFKLKCCSSYENKYFKFRILDEKVNGSYMHERVNSSERRYDLSSIELLEKGNSNATDFNVGGTYTFTGYAKGYGPDRNAKSTLNCEVKDLLTISLDVKSTNYITDGVSSLGDHHYNNLSSVYFSIPNSILEEYGSLQKIKAEWYEYRTTPVFFTNDTSKEGYDANYEALKDYIGVDISKLDDDKLPERSICEYVKNGVGGGAYGLLYNNEYHEISASTNPVRKLYTMAYLKAVKEDLNSSAILWKKDEFLDYMYEFYTKHGGLVKGDDAADEYLYERNLSACLFEDCVDDNRTRGYNLFEFDAGDDFDLLSYDDTHSGFERFWDYLFRWGTNTSESYSDVEAIKKVEFSKNSDGTFNIPSGQELLIDELDTDAFVEHCKSAYAKNQTTYLFRFAVTDYYYNTLLVGNRTTLFQDGTRNMSYAYQTVFLDFDIIQLTFNKDGVYSAIPVVHSPQDIASNVEGRGSGCQGDYETLLSILLLAVLCLFVYWIITKIINFLKG